MVSALDGERLARGLWVSDFNMYIKRGAGENMDFIISFTFVIQWSFNLLIK